MAPDQDDQEFQSIEGQQEVEVQNQNPHEEVLYQDPNGPTEDPNSEYAVPHEEQPNQMPPQGPPGQMPYLAPQDQQKPGNPPKYLPPSYFMAPPPGQMPHQGPPGQMPPQGYYMSQGQVPPQGQPG